MNFRSKILFFGFLIYLNLSNAHGEGKQSQDASAKIPKEIARLGRKIFTYLESVSAPNENLLVSPTNIYHAMALLHMAAGGSTLKEMTDLMGVPTNKGYSKSDIHSVLSAFYKNITTSDQDPIILNIADGLFLRDGFKIKKDYLDNAVKLYQSQILNVDFSRGKGAPNKINLWVSEKTRGRIPKIVDDNLDPATEALIISTLYFNARWYNPFSKAATKKDKFFTGEREVDAQMMHLIERLPYVNNPELQFESIDLSYDSTFTSDYALNIILPYPNQTVKSLIPKLKDISINQIMEKEKVTGVDVKLPKIKFNIFKSLVATFKYLGVNQLFVGANLQDLTDANLRVSEIHHGAEIEINEEGTIATAVTSVHMVPASAPLPIRDPVPFHVKRPFIVNIYDRTTSLTLFTGVVYKPEAESSRILF